MHYLTLFRRDRTHHIFRKKETYKLIQHEIFFLHEFLFNASIIRFSWHTEKKMLYQQH